MIILDDLYNVMIVVSSWPGIIFVSGDDKIVIVLVILSIVIMVEE